MHELLGIDFHDLENRRNVTVNHVDMFKPSRIYTLHYYDKVEHVKTYVLFEIVKEPIRDDRCGQITFEVKVLLSHRNRYRDRNLLIFRTNTNHLVESWYFRKMGLLEGYHELLTC